MSAPMEILDLLFYCVQQLGIMLGVGGEIIILVAYLLDIRDAAVTPKEEHFARVVKRVVHIGLVSIILSGIGITFVHFSSLQTATVLEPAYLFKWSLIVVLVVISLLNRTISLSSGLIEGLAGGTWLALLLVHVLAPVTSWSFLGVLYAIWMLAFVVCWTAALFLMGGSKVFTADDKQGVLPILPKNKLAPPVAPATNYSPLPPMQPNYEVPVQEIPYAPVVSKQPPQEYVPPPQRVTAQPALAGVTFSLIYDEAFPYKKLLVDGTEMLHPHLTEEREVGIPLAPPDPARTSIVSIKESDVTEHLPAVRIMPQKPEDLETQHKGPIIKFG